MARRIKTTRVRKRKNSVLINPFAGSRKSPKRRSPRPKGMAPGRLDLAPRYSNHIPSGGSYAQGGADASVNTGAHAHGHGSAGTGSSSSSGGVSLPNPFGPDVPVGGTGSGSGGGGRRPRPKPVPFSGSTSQERLASPLTRGSFGRSGIYKAIDPALQFNAKTGLTEDEQGDARKAITGSRKGRSALSATPDMLKKAAELGLIVAPVPGVAKIRAATTVAKALTEGERAAKVTESVAAKQAVKGAVKAGTRVKEREALSHKLPPISKETREAVKPIDRGYDYVKNRAPKKVTDRVHPKYNRQHGNIDTREKVWNVADELGIPTHGPNGVPRSNVEIARDIGMKVGKKGGTFSTSLTRAEKRKAITTAAGAGTAGFGAIAAAIGYDRTLATPVYNSDGAPKRDPKDYSPKLDRKVHASQKQLRTMKHGKRAVLVEDPHGDYWVNAPKSKGSTDPNNLRRKPMPEHRSKLAKALSAAAGDIGDAVGAGEKAIRDTAKDVRKLGKSRGARALRNINKDSDLKKLDRAITGVKFKDAPDTYDVAQKGVSALFDAVGRDHVTRDGKHVKFDPRTGAKFVGTPTVRDATRALRAGSGGGTPFVWKGEKLIDRRDGSVVFADKGKALFNHEGRDVYKAALKHNAPFATKGPWQTKLTPKEEKQFREWGKNLNGHDLKWYGFDPDREHNDYDMRGYWKSGAPGMKNGHFPDTFKTPFDATFSRESKYAKKGGALRYRKDGRESTPGIRRVQKDARSVAVELIAAEKARIKTGKGPTIDIPGDEGIFVNTIAKKTGMSPRVIAAWTRQEGGNSTGDWNRLNIGHPDSGPTSSAFDPGWKDPKTAGNLTADFILGKKFSPSTSIAAIRGNAVGKSDEQQVAAIANSDWAGDPAYQQHILSAMEGVTERIIPASKPKPVPKQLLADAQRLEVKAQSLGLKGPITMARPGGTGPIVNGKELGKPPKQIMTRLNAGIAAADKLEELGLPYIWGGGHVPGRINPVDIGGLDCSGTVSYIGQVMGVMKGSLVSGDFGSVTKPGPGAVTVFYNPTHVFMKIGNRYFGTSSADNPGGGPGYITKANAESQIGTGAFNVGHFPGMGKKVALQLGIKPGAALATPGLNLSADGTVATFADGAGTTLGKPGFSNKPIRPEGAGNYGGGIASPTLPDEYTNLILGAGTDPGEEDSADAGPLSAFTSGRGRPRPRRRRR